MYVLSGLNIKRYGGIKYRTLLSALSFYLMFMLALPGCDAGYNLCYAVNEDGSCEPEPEDLSIVAEGEVCTIEPAAITDPCRIIYVIDDSGSMTTNDPQNLRVSAVLNQVNSLSGNQYLKFGAVGFEEDAFIIQDFTNDAAVIQTSFNALESEGGTNYYDALSIAEDMMTDELETMPTQELLASCVVINFLSDGVPTVGNTSPDAIVNKVADIKTVAEEVYGIFAFSLNTVALLPAGGGGGTELQILQDMATAGGGQFVASAASELEFPFDVAGYLKRFEAGRLFAYNENARLKPNNPWSQRILLADSDGDGLVDLQEEEMASLGYNPLSPESWGPGCPDMVNYVLEQDGNPGTCAAMVQQIQSAPTLASDEDGDGKNRLTEQKLRTNRQYADTDLDGRNDCFETVFDGTPLDPNDDLLDRDSDGYSDAHEMEHGTDPNGAESQVERDAYALRISALTPSGTDVGLGRTCYNFKVNNIQLAPTKATEENAANENNICVSFVQDFSPDPLGQPAVLTACKKMTGVFDENGNLTGRIPEDGKLRFSNEDFVVTQDYREPPQ